MNRQGLQRLPLVLRSFLACVLWRADQELFDFETEFAAAFELSLEQWLDHGRRDAVKETHITHAPVADRV